MFYRARTAGYLFFHSLFGLGWIAFVLMLFFLHNHFFSPPSVGDDFASVEAQASEGPLVILDAGHGGRDPGAISVLGDVEKNLNLIITKKLGAFLQAAGIRVIYTRTEDKALTTQGETTHKGGDLQGRVNLARQYPDATFISIHMNTLPIEKYCGLQVFYEEKSLSHTLALEIQNTVRMLLQENNDRQVKCARGSIYVLDRLEQDAVLIECGFLSNREEAALLRDEDYQNRLAFTISRAVINFTLMKAENAK